MVDAVVLAGGNARGLDEVEAKGLVRVNGRPMYEYVVEALLACKDIGNICVVLPVQHTLYDGDGRVELVVVNDSLPRVIKAGVDALKKPDKTLILSADVPLLTPEAISDFLVRCKERDAVFYYPIVREGEAEKRFPQVKRTYVKVKDGKFTGGNIFLVDPALIRNNMELIERLYIYRKKPVKIAQVFGLMFLLRFLLGMLTIRQIEERVGQVVRGKCAGIITPYVEIGMDVDKESDLDVVTKAMTGGVA